MEKCGMSDLTLCTASLLVSTNDRCSGADSVISSAVLFCKGKIIPLSVTAGVTHSSLEEGFGFIFLKINVSKINVLVTGNAGLWTSPRGRRGGQ